MPLKHNATLLRYKKYLLPGISLFSIAVILTAFFFLIFALDAETPSTQGKILSSKSLKAPLTRV